MTTPKITVVFKKDNEQQVYSFEEYKSISKEKNLPTHLEDFIELSSRYHEKDNRERMKFTIVEEESHLTITDETVPNKPNTMKFSKGHSKFLKFMALAGVVGQLVMATRPEVSQTSTTLGIISGLGLGCLAIMLAKEVSPEHSLKKAAFLGLGGVALTTLGMSLGFDTDPVKNAFLSIPTVMTVAGLSITLNHYGEKSRNKMKS